MAAQQKYGHEFWAPMLMARHTHRFSVAFRRPGLVPDELWKVAARAPIFDIALTRLGASWWRYPDMYGRSPVDHVHWAVDQVVEVTRLVRLGDILGATAIVRQQVERWTLNIAEGKGLTRGVKESRTDFIGRVWETVPECQIDVGAAWAQLSQWLHGRGDVLGAIAWDLGASDPLRGSVTVPKSTLDSGRLLASLLDLALYPASGVGCLLARERGRPELQPYLTAKSKIKIVPDFDRTALNALRPIDFSTAFASDMRQVVREGQAYRRHVADPMALSRLKRGLPKGMAERAILERRARAVEGARDSFKKSSEVLKEDFDPAGLDTRIFRFIAVTETSQVMAEWSTGNERTALLVAASAARAAWRFWLEDTDIAPVCIRTVLEQTCRARAWRLRPVKADALDRAPGLASPARWIDLAGWKRASVLSRSLGEFSHVELRSRRTGARQVLEEMQSPGTQEHLRRYLARGSALDHVFNLLAFELLARLEDLAPELPESFRQAITLVDAELHDKQVEELLNLGLGLRGFDFGPPDYRRRE